MACRRRRASGRGFAAGQPAFAASRRAGYPRLLFIDLETTALRAAPARTRFSSAARWFAGGSSGSASSFSRASRPSGRCSRRLATSRQRGHRGELQRQVVRPAADRDPLRAASDADAVRGDAAHRHAPSGAAHVARCGERGRATLSSEHARGTALWLCARRRCGGFEIPGALLPLRARRRRASAGGGVRAQSTGPAVARARDRSRRAVAG